MGDQQAVKPGFGQTAAQKPDAAKVVHDIRITGAGNRSAAWHCLARNKFRLDRYN
jgi:hypothetical protein